MTYSLRILLLIVGLVAASASCSAAQQRSTVIPLSFGITRMDLIGGGQPGMAVLGWRENFNAHGFDVLTLYVRVSSWKGSPSTWQIVPLFNKDKEQTLLTVSGGGDCVLHDFRLIAARRPASVQLIVANREFGENYASVAEVTFDFYALRKNAQGVPGRPLYYYELTRSLKAKHTYCDVGRAFRYELGLGPYM
jgi:hypothetical protein